MKPASLLSLFVLSLVLTGCNTLVTQRDLYAPNRGKGPWTDKFYAQRKGEGIYGISNSYHRGAGPGPDTGIFGISHPSP